MLNKFLLFTFVLLISGCSVKYVAQPNLSVIEASEVIERLTLTQDARFKPNSIKITKDNIHYSYNGSIVKAKRRTGSVYFKYVQYTKIGQIGVWYNIQTFDKNDRYLGKVYHSSNLQDIQDYVDAFESILHSR